MFGYETDRQAVLFIGASIGILHKSVTALQIAEQTLVQRVKLLRRKGTIICSPPDMILRLRVTHHKLIVCRTRCVFAGVGNEGAIHRNRAFAAEDRLFIKCFRWKIPERQPQIANTMIGQGQIGFSHLRHGLGRAFNTE